MALQPLPTTNADDGVAGLEIIEPLCAVFRRGLKNDGQKYTPERAAILDAIIRLDAVFEADTLLIMLKDEGFRVSKATIYRTLKLLQDYGIIQPLPFDRDQSHYMLAYGRSTNAILVRVDTGAVETIDLPELTELAEKLCAERGIELEGRRLQVFARGAKPKD